VWRDDNASTVSGVGDAGDADVLVVPVYAHCDPISFFFPLALLVPSVWCGGNASAVGSAVGSAAVTISLPSLVRWWSDS